MEFAAAALTSIASTTGSAASAIGGAVSSGAAGLFSGATGFASTAASILSGGATVLSVLNAQRSGEAKADNLLMQAADSDTNARIEQLQGLDRSNSLKAKLVQQLGERDVATAASGVDLSFGTPVVARAQDVRAGERALAIDADTTETRIARLRERAANYRIGASQARSGGLGQAAALALEGGVRLMRRG